MTKWLVAFSVFASSVVATAGDARELTIVKTDPTAALRYAVAYIEAGFQRGELSPALKRFSDTYTEYGVPMSHNDVRARMIEILEAKERIVQASENKGGIYFEIEGLEIKGDRGSVRLRAYVYPPSDRSALKKVSVNLTFETAGGGWVLKASDGLLERILRACSETGMESDS